MILFLLGVIGCSAEWSQRNFSPSLLLIHPEDSVVYNANKQLAFEVAVSDPEDRFNELGIFFQSDVDGFLLEGQPDTAGTFKILSDPLSPGAHQLSAWVEDSEGEVSRQEILLYFNSPPVVSLLKLNPEAPSTNHDLEIQVIEGSDAEGDDITYAYQWYQNGNRVEGETSNILSSELTSKDDYWKVRVTPSDQYGVGEPIERSVFIENVPTGIDSIAIVQEDSAYSDSTFQCIAQATDADNDDFVIAYSWQKMTAGFLTDFEALGPSITLTPETFQPLDILICTATAIEEGQEEYTSQSAQVSIENRHPVVDEVLIVPSTGVRPGTTLACTANGSDPDLDTLTTRFRWLNNGQVIGIHSTLELTTEHGSKGDVIECIATIEDTYLSTASATTSVTIQNTPPVMATIGLNPQQPSSQDNIECVPLATDVDLSDQEQLSYVFAWRIDNVLQSETGEVLSAPFSVGSTIECTAYAFDGEEYGTQLTSSVSIRNTAPVIHSVTLDTNEIYTNDVINLVIDSNDVDGDNIIHYIKWYVDGVLVKEGYGDNLDGAQYFDKNNQIVVEITPNDGTTDGLLYLSSTFVVLNSPPTEPEIEIFPAEVLPREDDLFCQLTTPSDADGDDISYEISWYINGALWLGGTTTTALEGDTILASDTSDGDIWSCGIEITDTDSAVTTVQSAEITISCADNYGLAEACPATSCNEVITLYPQLYLSDGLYWLSYERVSGPEIFEAYCNMSHDGGGWTLAMKFDESTEDLHYNDVRWENYDLLNESDYLPNLDIAGSTAKFEAYNGIPGEVMRLEFLSPAYNIHYYDLAGQSLFELFYGDTVAVVETSTGCQSPDADGYYSLQTTDDWDDNLMRQGVGSSFFGVNGDWTGSVGGTTQTTRMRFGYGATGANHHLWFPQIGIGMYNSSDYGNFPTTYTYTSVVWNEQTGCGSPCHACQGDGLGYETTDTSANLWIR